MQVEYEVFNAPQADLAMYLRQAQFDFIKIETEKARVARDARKKYLDEQFRQQVQERPVGESLGSEKVDDPRLESEVADSEGARDRSCEASKAPERTSPEGVPDEPKTVARKTKPRRKAGTKRKPANRSRGSSTDR